MMVAPVKACNFTDIRLRHGVFLWAKSFTKILAKKYLLYLSADGCFVKTNINCDDNDNAICFLGRLLLLGSPWNEIWLEVLERSICLAVWPFYVDKSFDLQKNRRWTCLFPRKIRAFANIETMQKFSLFSKGGAIV